MRIVRLQAEGFKRLVAVDITPEGDLIEVRGNNGNGKSSVLDAIFATLAGAGAAPEKPVREGEEAAVIRLDLGELIVTRYFTAAGTTGLKVTTPDGASYGSGQTMLDNLVGAISFDPLEFLSLKPAEQAEELRKLVTIADPETGEVVDLEAFATERAKLYSSRRDVNRDGVNLKARVEAAGGVRHVPDDAPDRAELVRQMAAAGDTNSAIDAEERNRAAGDAEQEVRLERIVELKRELVDLERSAATYGEAVKARGPLPDRVDVAELSKALDEADRVQANRDANALRDGLIAEFEALKAKSVGLSADIKALDARRAAAIAAAKMPVEGLELVLREDDTLGVDFNGVPFSQASDAERLRVSAAVAMAANPDLRVLRLKDASLLDKGAVEALREMATSNDFQIWAEFVGDEGPGIVMEAGEVRGAPAPEPLPKPRQRKAKEDAPTEEREGEVATAERSSDAPPADGAPSTLFERMAALSGKPADDFKPTEETRKPRALSSFSTKPRS